MPIGQFTEFPIPNKDGADADQEIEAGYNARVATPSNAELDAGASTPADTVRRFTIENITRTALSQLVRLFTQNAPPVAEGLLLYTGVDMAPMRYVLNGDRPPAVTDDDTLGFRAGSRWLDIVAGEEYVLKDATTNQADWLHVSLELDAVIAYMQTGGAIDAQIVWDMDLGPHGLQFTATGPNVDITNPIGGPVLAGNQYRRGIIEVTQDATGGWLPSYGNAFVNTAIANDYIDTSPNAVTALPYVYTDGLVIFMISVTAATAGDYKSDGSIPMSAAITFDELLATARVMHAARTSEALAGDLEITAQDAWDDAVTFLVGGGLTIRTGHGAANSSGLAHSGPLTLKTGDSYGSGDSADVVLAAGTPQGTGMPGALMHDTQPIMAWVYPRLTPGSLWRRGWQTYYDGRIYVAKRATYQTPEIVPEGPPAWYADQGALPSWTIANQASNVVLVGQRYTWAGASGYLTRLRMYITIDDAFTYVTPYLKINPGQLNESVIVGNEYLASGQGPIDFDMGNIFLVAGTEFDLSLRIEDHEATDVTLANYNYTKPNNPTSPVAGTASHANNLQSVIRFNVIDNDVTDRTAVLEALSIGDTITVAGFSWTVDGPIEINGTWRGVPVTPALQYTSDGVAEFTFTRYISGSVDVHYLPGLFSGDSQVQGFISLTGHMADAVFDGNGYEVDIEVQESSVPDDFDIIAIGDSSGVDQGLVDTLEYIPIPAAAFAPRPTAGGVPITLEMATSGFGKDAMSFDSVEEQAMDIVYDLPDTYDRQAMKAVIAWSAGAGALASDIIELGISAHVTNNGEVEDAALPAAIVVADTVSNTTHFHRTSVIEFTPGGTKQSRSQLSLRVIRPLSGTDNMAALLNVQGVTLQYVKTQANNEAWT